MSGEIEFENKVPDAGVNVCADEYDGTDKETETKPDVVFLGVSLLVAELSCLSKSIVGTVISTEQQIESGGHRADKHEAGKLRQNLP